MLKKVDKTKLLLPVIGGRAVNVIKQRLERTASDCPVRSEFIDSLRNRIHA